MGGFGGSRKPIPHKQLKEFLTDAQLGQWKADFEGELISLEAMAPRMLGGGAMFAVPAGVAPARIVIENK